MKDQHKDDTTLTAEAKYHINLTQSGKIFVLSLIFVLISLLMLQKYLI